MGISIDAWGSFPVCCRVEDNRERFEGVCAHKTVQFDELRLVGRKPWAQVSAVKWVFLSRGPVSSAMYEQAISKI